MAAAGRVLAVLAGMTMARLPGPADLGSPRILDSGGVPSYSVQRPDAKPRDNAQADALGVVANAVDKASLALARTAAREKLESDTARAEDGFNRLREQQHELTQGPDGFTRLKGTDALKPDLLNEWTTKFDDRAKSIEDSLENGEQKQAFRKRAGFARQQYTGAFYQHTARERDAFNADVFKATISTEVRAVGANPADDDGVGLSWARALAAVDTEGRRLGHTPEMISASRATVSDQLWVARLDAWRLNDPEGALGAFQANAANISPNVRLKLAESLYSDAAPVLASRMLQGPLVTFAATDQEARAITEAAGGMGLQAKVTVDQQAAAEGSVFDRLPGDQKLKVLHLAKTEASQRMAQTREGLNHRMTDAVAALERGLPAPRAPTEDELRFAYGEEGGAQRARHLAAARGFGEDYTRIASMSRAEQDALLQQRRPNSARPGFAEEQRRFEQLASVVDRVRREQEQDPATYVLQQSPARAKSLKAGDSPTNVKVAWEAFVQSQSDGQMTAAQRASAAQAYAESTIAEQKRLGISAPQILPKSMVDSIEKRFASPPQQGQNVANVMSGMVEQWGRYWPQVGAQLKGKIPPEATVIGLGVTPEAEQLLAEASKLKPEELRQGMADAEVKDLRERLRTNLEPLRRSLAFQGGGVQTYDNYADSSERIALMLMHRGMSPKDAAAKASESVIGFKYQFEDTWRVPKTALGGDRTVSALRAGAVASQHDIGSEKPVIGERVPLLVPRAPAGVRPEDADRQWRDTIRSNGFWVTSPGDSGLTLYVKSGLGAQPVLDARGQPVRRSWEELAAVGNSVRAATMGDLGPRRP
jgi:hypothetical protein